MEIRPRRLRSSASMRAMLAETKLAPENLVLPIFLAEGRGLQESISSMPGVSRWSLDTIHKQIKEALDCGVRAVEIFPKISESQKDPMAKEALNPNGLIPRAIRELKKEYRELIVISDIALDPYSSDGHDGIVRTGKICNDESVEILAKMALLHAEAGCDLVAPSDMMDGRVRAIRKTLDENKLHETGILSYSAKYCSAFYGPFRDALDSAPRAGDKKTYQMNPRNFLEARREVALDIEEGADIVMIKPAGAYLDIIHDIRALVDVPVAAYQVSGEYSMIQFGAERGIFRLEDAMEESLYAIRRAGADLIFTYFAIQMARRLKA